MNCYYKHLYFFFLFPLLQNAPVPTNMHNNEDIQIEEDPIEELQSPENLPCYFENPIKSTYEVYDRLEQFQLLSCGGHRLRLVSQLII